MTEIDGDGCLARGAQQGVFPHHVAAQFHGLAARRAIGQHPIGKGGGGRGWLGHEVAKLGRCSERDFQTNSHCRQL